ncbi:MAG: hypothetical protein WC469_04100 [Candidatus Omnitrophota bacterium]
MTEAKNIEIEDGKFFAVISYISFLCVLALLLKKENKFSIHHAKQGLVLFVFESMFFILSIIPILGWFIGWFGFTAFLLLSVWGMFKASQGAYSRLPVIANIADKVSL